MSTCNTVLTFPAAPPPAFSAGPLSPPAAPAPLAGQAPPPAGPPAEARPFSLAGLDQIASITLPIGLFFLFLEVLAAFLPWAELPFVGRRSGIALQRQHSFFSCV